MKLEGVILSIILIQVATKSFVKGLQCYVCEDCNEYEDFKELHICGEIPFEMTMKPFTPPDIFGGSTTNTPFSRTSGPTTTSTLNNKTTLDDYLYEDSDERLDVQNAKQKNVTVKVLKQTSTTSVMVAVTSTQSVTTQKPTITTTQSAAASKESKSENKSTTSTIGVISSTKPISGDYDDDYVEYEDPLTMSRSKEKSWLRISEPVCYMMRYHANNTIITNRGCTTFIDANKYLTCQSLYNGAPMESCRVCSSNGCNKFLNDYDYDDHSGILLNAAAARQRFGILMLLLWILFGRAII